MSAPLLNRRAVLEQRADVSDGAGGVLAVWQARGTIWVALRFASLRVSAVAGGTEPRPRWQVWTRAVSDEAPVPGDRLRTEGRVLRVLSVAEDARAPGHLVCVAEEDTA